VAEHRGDDRLLLRSIVPLDAILPLVDMTFFDGNSIDDDTLMAWFTTPIALEQRHATSKSRATVHVMTSRTPWAISTRRTAFTWRELAPRNGRGE